MRYAGLVAVLLNASAAARSALSINCSHPAAVGRPEQEVLAFAGGWDGPIDNGDDWRYFDLSLVTTVVSLGPVPSGLVCKARAEGVRVARFVILDVDTIAAANAVSLHPTPRTLARSLPRAHSVATIQCVLVKFVPHLVCSTAFPDMQVQRNRKRQDEWAAATAANAAQEGVDGVVVSVGPEVNTLSRPAVAGVTAAIKTLRTALPTGALLAVMVPLHTATEASQSRSSSSSSSSSSSAAGGDIAVAGTFPLDVKALAGACDYLVAQAYDQCYGAPAAGTNMAIGSIGATVSAFGVAGVPRSKLVVALAWYGWHFKCGPTASASTASSGHGTVRPCDTRPPATTPAVSWHGWNTQVSYAYIQSFLNSSSKLRAAVDKETESMWLRWTDEAGAMHALAYDNPTTLKAKYAACAAAGVKGVGIMYADNVGYTGDDRPDALKMWGSLEGFRPVVLPSVRPTVAMQPAAASASASVTPPPALPSLPTAGRGAGTSHALTMSSALARQMWRRAGVTAGTTIPGKWSIIPSPPSSSITTTTTTATRASMPCSLSLLMCALRMTSSHSKASTLASTPNLGQHRRRPLARRRRPTAPSACSASRLRSGVVAASTSTSRDSATLQTRQSRTSQTRSCRRCRPRSSRRRRRSTTT